MEMTELITALLSEMKKISSSETVVGKPITVGEATVIPVNKLALGFGLGAGDLRGDKTEKGRAAGTSAVGGGVTIQPQAFIVVGADGHAHLLSLDAARESPLVRAIDMLPEVADRVMKTGGALLRRKEAGQGDEESPAAADEDAAS